MSKGVSKVFWLSRDLITDPAEDPEEENIDMFLEPPVLLTYPSRRRFDTFETDCIGGFASACGLIDLHKGEKKDFHLITHERYQQLMKGEK